MDTTSNALSRIFSLLAERPDVQEKLRAEILEAQEGDRSDIPYEDLVKLPYLDAVCRETLRVYVPHTFFHPSLHTHDQPAVFLLPRSDSGSMLFLFLSVADHSLTQHG